MPQATIDTEHGEGERSGKDRQIMGKNQFETVSGLFKTTYGKQSNRQRQRKRR